MVGTHVVGMKKIFQGFTGLRYADTPMAMPLPYCPWPNRSQGLGCPCDCAPQQGAAHTPTHKPSAPVSLCSPPGMCSAACGMP